MAPEDEAPLPRDEALELIRGLERASRHRQFLLYGLLAILAGFILLSVYLYRDREEEKAQVARLEVQQLQLVNTLELARRHALRLDSDPRARAGLMAALNVAIGRVAALDTIFDEKALPDETSAAPPAPAQAPPEAVAGPAAIPAAPLEPILAAAEPPARERPVRNSGEGLLYEDPCEEVFARDPTVVECSWHVE